MDFGFFLHMTTATAQLNRIMQFILSWSLKRIKHICITNVVFTKFCNMCGSCLSCRIVILVKYLMNNKVIRRLPIKTRRTMDVESIGFHLELHQAPQKLKSNRASIVATKIVAWVRLGDIIAS